MMRQSNSRPGSTTSRRHSSYKGRRSMSFRARLSNRKYGEEQTTEPILRCNCDHCQMRERKGEQMAEERDRIEINVSKVLKAVKVEMENAIRDLEQLVRFKSISVQPEQLLESCSALDWLADRLTELKFKVQGQTLPDNPINCFVEPHQKLLFAKYFSSPTKNTLLVYAHLDVLPVNPDCWFSDPFKLTAKSGQLYGRGVTSGKGMLVGWLHAIETWLSVHEDLPINVKFIVDMLHEVGSTGLQEAVRSKADFFLDVDFIAFDVNSWVNTVNPVVACSLTGWAHFGVEVIGANKSLEGGLAGGLVFEPMVDLCHLMNRLVSNQHEMEFNLTSIKQLTTQEWNLLDTADFSVSEYKEHLYVPRIKYEGNKVELLQNRWCKPALTMHGVVGAHSRPECSCILPMHVMGKFSIKLVPDQNVSEVHSVVKHHLQRMARDLEMGTKLNVHLLDNCEPSIWSTNSSLVKAVMRAVSVAHEREPIATQAIPICLPIASVLRKLIEKPVILVPYMKRCDRHHQENENVQEFAFMKHCKLCASLLHELSTLRPKCKCDLIHEYCLQRGYRERAESVDFDTRVSEPKKRKFVNNFFRLRTAGKTTKSSKKRMNLMKFLCLPFKWKRIRKNKKKNARRRPSSVSF